MRRVLVLLAALASLHCASVRAQGAATVYVQETEPTGVAYGALWIVPSSGTAKIATATNPLAWTAIIGGGGSALPAGLIVWIDAGTCPSGFAEVAGLNGRTLIGTLAANGNVGTTGGSDTLTPAGSNSVPTFTGSALGTHLHAFGTLAVAAHTVVATKQGAAAGNVVTTATHTVSGSTAAITAGTPAGTVTAPVFTGTPGENRSAFLRLIACRST